jgi:hypothetical protein
MALLLSASAAGQTPEGFLDVFAVKVKPEKRAEFDAIVKKMVDANRKNKGDTWLSGEVAYGEGNTVNFTSFRANYDGIEKGFESFMSALGKAYGQAAAGKIFQDFSNCIVSTRSELRRRRPDLSANLPANPAAVNKLIGESRWVRTTMVRVRPGRTADYEAQLKIIKAAADKDSSRMPTLISQSVAGVQGTTFYITALRSSLAGFDTAVTPLPQLIGESGYSAYQKTVAESVLSTETIISRFLPELSNPPEEIASASPDYWRPKPPAAKPAPATSGAKSEVSKK